MDVPQAWLICAFDVFVEGFQKKMARLHYFVNYSSKWNRLHCSVDFVSVSVLMVDPLTRSAEVASRPRVVSCNIHGNKIDGLHGRKWRIEIVKFVQVGGCNVKQRLVRTERVRKKKYTK
jgi:hypothetical protein